LRRTKESPLGKEKEGKDSREGAGLQQQEGRLGKTASGERGKKRKRPLKPERNQITARKQEVRIGGPAAVASYRKENLRHGKRGGRENKGKGGYLSQGFGAYGVSCQRKRPRYPKRGGERMPTAPQKKRIRGTSVLEAGLIPSNGKRDLARQQVKRRT